MDSITDIGAVSVLLIIIVILLLIDVNIKENFDVSGLDSNEIAKISDNYNKGAFTFTNVNATYFNLLPKGSIVMFQGTSIPSGWTLCNGQRGTPNLIGRIPMGDTKSGTLAGPVLNSTGSTTAAGNHSHTVNKGTRKFLNSAWGADKKRRTVLSNASTGNAGNHSHTVTVNKVSSIYPNRTTLTFIMKL